ncbi:hypothetical protein BV25DRAFT_1843397 [Artomyces pyxidatus]|uniref:Uncharacterized protein n=1 Tax=Artomyces pyxidatus TaxID=48021 RepID=A0ACB8SFV2_9AGAM|nr:hypothetical protein BV25DRAFT_1843397 [Artomyces pyxidatus]
MVTKQDHYPLETHPVVPRTAREIKDACRRGAMGQKALRPNSSQKADRPHSPSPFVGPNPAISPSDPLPKEIGLGFWERLYCSTRASYDDLDEHHVRLHARLQRYEVALRTAQREAAQAGQLYIRLAFAERRLALVEYLCRQHLGCADIDGALEHHNLSLDGVTTTSQIAASVVADDGMDWDVDVDGFNSEYDGSESGGSKV